MVALSSLVTDGDENTRPYVSPLTKSKRNHHVVSNVDFVEDPPFFAR